MNIECFCHRRFWELQNVFLSEYLCQNRLQILLPQPEVCGRKRCFPELSNNWFFILVCFLFLFQIKLVTKCSWKHENSNNTFGPSRITFCSHSINTGLFPNICLESVPKKTITIELGSKLKKRVGWKRKNEAHFWGLTTLQNEKKGKGLLRNPLHVPFSAS